MSDWNKLRAQAEELVSAAFNVGQKSQIDQGMALFYQEGKVKKLESENAALKLKLSSLEVDFDLAVERKGKLMKELEIEKSIRVLIQCGVRSAKESMLPVVEVEGLVRLQAGIEVRYEFGDHVTERAISEALWKHKALKLILKSDGKEK